MVSSLYSGASAMQSYQTATDVTANNIANINTGGYTAKSTVLAETKPAGVKVAAIQDTPPHVRSAADSAIARKQSNVDLATEKVDEITSFRAYQANAKPVQTVDDMLGTVINMKA
ncbi:MAG: flagellar basal body protein [Deferribacteraceae bacterium]|jgi:flagellar hook protein FlgE|nr:flagellar basal body protein [Deferribacteraceae bacterium]